MADEDIPSRRRLILGRRRHPRAIVDCLLSLQRLDMPDFMAHALDMSLGGMRLQCVGFKITLQETMRFHFSLGENSFTFFGRAIRIRNLDSFSQEVGIAFSPMTSEVRTLLRRSLYNT